jgi:uncharacterized lipoprotein YmbA
MKIKNKISDLFLAFGVVALLIAGGCASSPSPRQYVFAPDEGWKSVATRDVGSSQYIIRFAPVRLPDYLDRPQIVTRASENQIFIDEFHRWGVPLNVTVTEVLGASISMNLPDAYVDVMPSRDRKADGYQIQVDIVRLDGTLGGMVELIAQWKVVSTGDSSETVAQKLTLYQQKADNESYESYVNAIRKSLSTLGADMAGVIKEHQGN